jgi:ubiquinone/menaquinone biosynthesis C-methylase UbiE
MKKAVVQVSTQHYQSGYDTKQRFASYWYQLNEILALQPETVLEVGVGSGVVSHFLETKGVSVSTLDIDKELNPTKSGSVTAIPWKDNTFDVVSCCQVLEHLPFDEFLSALKELRRVSKKGIVLSLPDSSRYWKFFLHIPFIVMISEVVDLPILPLEHRFDGQHYWEIGKKGYPKEEILNRMQEAKLEVKKEFRPFENPYHRFFILKDSSTK